MQSEAYTCENGSAQGIHLMAKPAGAACNLRCTYCFYLEKSALYLGTPGGCRMSDETLEAYVRQTVAADTGSPDGILFTWQGGEPTLMGLDFFRRAVELEQKVAAGRPFHNCLQTNGTLLDDEWCRFLADHRFLVGLSLDGPPFVHDHHRVDVGGRGTSERVLAALTLLQKHGVATNVMAAISRHGSQYPIEIYEYFKKIGVRYIQFSPIVERMPTDEELHLGLKLGGPGSQDGTLSAVSPWSVSPEAFADFHIKIFDHWVRNDVGTMFIMNFEWALHAFIGGGSPVCYMSERCGDACIVEHNGDLYSCDHFVYPEFRLGNILQDDARTLVMSRRQRDFGGRKESLLPDECRSCHVGHICRGGCPKHRFATTGDGHHLRNYLCAGYKGFYTFATKYMLAFARLLEFDLPPETIMKAIAGPLVIPASAKTGNRQVVLWIK